MAIMSPTSTIGSTKPELVHFDSKYLLSLLEFTYKGDNTTAEARANTMPSDLCEEEPWHEEEP